ncbi:UPF0147 family protein [Candidatus Micrarchaeota archaeon]|nr:UPF0147 family protein [Candidatus Micrarchaeota archaeon]MBU2476895.1 UPF0147 family protein [Candidatus Micrarchaeota archaeon]
MNKKEIDASYVTELMEAVMQDSSVPRNIRRVVEEAKTKIESKKELKELDLHVSSAIYLLDDISNDINMPAHTRTEIWTIISELENLKEKIK